MEKTSHTPTKLEEFFNNGYHEVSRTPDRQWVVLENKEGGLIYDIQADKIIRAYKFEMWQRPKAS